MRTSRFFSVVFAICVFWQGSLINAQEQGAAYGSKDALLEYRNGNYESAMSICKAEIAQDASNIDSYVVLCWSLLKLGRYTDTRTYAEQAQRYSRGDVRLVEILGEVYFYLGRNEEAVKYFEEYVRSSPNGARIDVVYYFLGEIYIRQGRFRYADISLSTAVHYVPLNAAWWIRLGYARERAGDYGEALTAYEKALGLDSGLQDARRGVERVRSNLR